MTHVKQNVVHHVQLVRVSSVAGLTTNGRDANNPTTRCTTCLCVRSCSGVWHIEHRWLCFDLLCCCELVFTLARVDWNDLFDVRLAVTRELLY